jgi:hypothetical protein
MNESRAAKVRIVGAYRESVMAGPKPEPVNPEVILRAVDGLLESQQSLIDKQNELIGRLMERIRILESPALTSGAGIESLKIK